MHPNYSDLSNCEQRAAAILAVIGKCHVKSMLDLGSRRCEMLDFIAAEMPGIDRFAAVDISEESLDDCRKKGYETAKVDLESEPLPFEDGVFDCVLATEVIEHLARHSLLLSEIHRVLKPDGRLIITVPNVARLKNRVKMLFGYDPHRIYPPSEHDVHIREFTGDSIAKLLGFSGFEKEKTLYIAFPTKNPIVWFAKRIMPSLRAHILCVAHKTGCSEF